MSKNTGKKSKGSVMFPKNSHRRGRINRYKRMKNVQTRLAPTPPPADAYDPNANDPTNRYSMYRKLEDTEPIPASQRKYLGRPK